MRVASSGDVTESTERVVVSRPFSSRVEVERDGEVVARRVSRFGALALEGEDGVAVLAVSPALGSSDVRADAALEYAAAAGLADRREVRAVGGRTCQVYRLGSTATDGSLVPVGAMDGQHADVCVDGRGLVLEEWWVRDGEPVRQRLATEVTVDVEPDGTPFTLEGEADAIRSPSDGRLEQLDDGDALTFASPSGFELTGTFEVTPARLDPPRTAVVSVWTRGPDFVAVERGTADVAEHPYAEAVDVDGVGRGELIVDLRASEVRLVVGDLLVRVYGTLAPDELVTLAASLRRE